MSNNIPRPSIMDFVNRFKDWQSQRQSEEALMTDLLIYTEQNERESRAVIEKLQSQLKDATLDLEDARKSRRDMQQQLMLAGAKVSEVTMLANRNPYIIVLIDGDGMIVS